MKRLVVLLLTSLWATPALAGVPCSLPFNIQNGQPADATQIMANYNALVACLGNAAAAGTNTDITSLAGLTTPLSPSFGGTQTFVGPVNSTGSPNAQIVATTTPPWTALTRGYTVSFVAGFSNTGATTLQVGSSAAAAILRRTIGGPAPLAGGEIVASALTVVTYDGANFQLITDQSVPVGTVLETVGVTADPGFLLMQGQCIPNSGVFVILHFKMGSPGSGTCGAGQFRLPDGRGRVVAMIDSGGSNQITVAGGNFDGTIMYNSGGGQTTTIAQSNLPNTTLTVTSDGGSLSGTAPNTVTSGAGGLGPWGGGSGLTTTGGVLTLTDTRTWVTASINGSVTQTSFTNLPPILMLNRQVKY